MQYALEIISILIITNQVWCPHLPDLRLNIEMLVKNQVCDTSVKNWNVVQQPEFSTKFKDLVENFGKTSFD